jgi:hypothetical protein
MTKDTMLIRRGGRQQYLFFLCPEKHKKNTTGIFNYSRQALPLRQNYIPNIFKY